MEMVFLLWSIPFERMTIDEADRLIVISKLIQKEVKKTAAYLELLRKEWHQNDRSALCAEEFEELVNIYREAGEKNLTEYILLRVDPTQSDMERAGIIISGTLRVTDYFGYRNDGSLYILLTGTDRKDGGFMRKNLEEKGICTVISEEIGA